MHSSYFSRYMLFEKFAFQNEDLTSFQSSRYCANYFSIQKLQKCKNTEITKFIRKMKKSCASMKNKFCCNFRYFAASCCCCCCLWCCCCCCLWWWWWWLLLSLHRCFQFNSGKFSRHLCCWSFGSQGHVFECFNWKKMGHV